MEEIRKVQSGVVSVSLLALGWLSAGPLMACGDQPTALPGLNARTGAPTGREVRLLVSGADQKLRIGPWTTALTYELQGAGALDRSQVRVVLHSRHFSEDLTSEFSIARSGSRLVMDERLLREIVAGRRNAVPDGVLTFNFVLADFSRSYSFEQRIDLVEACDTSPGEMSITSAAP